MGPSPTRWDGAVRRVDRAPEVAPLVGNEPKRVLAVGRLAGNRGREGDMAGAVICINSQTPLIQFLPGADGALPEPSATVSLADLEQGVDYRVSPGGVTRMLLPLVRALIERGVVSEVHWVALNPGAPPVVRMPGVTLHNVHLEGDRLTSYRKVKDAMWGAIHGLAPGPESGDLFWSEEFSEYAFYNRATAERIRELDRELDFDTFYIHDFQQLPVGQMLDTLKPKIFRWHIPFDASLIPDSWKPPIAAYFNSYDVVVVSSLQYVSAVRAVGYAGHIRRVYPCVDPGEYERPPPTEVRRVTEGFGISAENVVALIVARMDPTKGQDGAIRAFAALTHSRPSLRLVLAGNGSFSGSAAGPGGSKGQRWRTLLEDLARELGVSERVIFTGHVTQHELDCLYERADFSILPSINEGFGLVVVESWLHRTPVMVTARAGIAELIQDGINGLLFDPSNLKEFSRKFARLADRPALRAELAKSATQTARKCSVAAALRSEARLVGRLAGE
jgi:glycosyltransferase involved in cell wall biosynthesis